MEQKITAMNQKKEQRMMKTLELTKIIEDHNHNMGDYEEMW